MFESVNPGPEKLACENEVDYWVGPKSHAVTQHLKGGKLFNIVFSHSVGLLGTYRDRYEERDHLKLGMVVGDRWFQCVELGKADKREKNETNVDADRATIFEIVGISLKASIFELPQLLTLNCCRISRSFAEAHPEEDLQ